jgi:LAS superfamily LD-carboxypeptidase LdcB
MKGITKLLLFLCFVPLFSLSPDELMGKTKITEDTNFVRFSSAGRTFFLRREAYIALTNMIHAAQKDGISLWVVSAYRSFDDQKRIWERKWNLFSSQYPDPQKRLVWILRYSSLPGTSRHHWGTDVDLVSVDPRFFLTAQGKKILSWLENHAPSYGFLRPYTTLSQRKGGYEEEPWHWSYAPLAREYLSVYTNLVQKTNIHGFLGDAFLDEIDITTYVLGINPDLLP